MNVAQREIGSQWAPLHHMHTAECDVTAHTILGAAATEVSPKRCGSPRLTNIGRPLLIRTGRVQMATACHGRLLVRPGATSMPCCGYASDLLMKLVCDFGHYPVFCSIAASTRQANWSRGGSTSR